LEFEEKSVAETAAKTMQGYILFGRQLDCHLVENAHKETFKNGNRDWKFIPNQVKFRNEKNREKTNDEKAAKVKGLLQKEKEKRDRLKELGIKYEFTGYVSMIIIVIFIYSLELLRHSKQLCKRKLRNKLNKRQQQDQIKRKLNENNQSMYRRIY